MATLRPDINTWGWRVALRENFSTESFSVQQCGEVNKLKEENSDIAKEMVETVFWNWSRCLFFFSEPQIKQHNVICILFNFRVHCGVGTPQAKWLMRIAFVCFHSKLGSVLQRAFYGSSGRVSAVRLCLCQGQVCAWTDEWNSNWNALVWSVEVVILWEMESYVNVCDWMKMSGRGNNKTRENNQRHKRNVILANRISSLPVLPVSDSVMLPIGSF